MTKAKDTRPSQDYDAFDRYYDLVLEPFLHRIRKRFSAWMKERPITRALDVGCGTGQQISMAPDGVESVGIDLSHSMLEQAHRKVPGKCVHGDATALPFDDGHFDLVYTQFALHEKDASVIDALLKEARRVLTPNGQLVVVDFTAKPHRGLSGKASARAIALVERAAGGEHFANYRGWMARGGIDQVLSTAGWSEEEAYAFYGGAIKMGVYRGV